MKQMVPRIFLIVLLFSFSSVGWAEEPLKILTIGNSFAGNVLSDLPQMAKAAGKNVLFFGANPGGCSMEKHAGWVKLDEANAEDPAGKPYRSNFIPGKPGDKDHKYSLREVLQAEKWNFVTIQQLSNASFMPESYEPYATTLIDTIRKYAPQARIVVFETWAYREDYAGYGRDGLDQQKMFEGLTAAYEKLAADHGLQIIPVGYAFQKARATDRWHFQYPDPDFDYKNPAPGTIPKQPGSLNMGWTWYTPPTGGKSLFVLDQKHGNAAGKLLAASVFYEALLGEDVQKNTFLPEKLDAADAADIRRIAHEAFASYQGPKVTMGK
ncbi:DUF4886 domain-containing protein [soil metagenome]